MKYVVTDLDREEVQHRYSGEAFNRHTFVKQGKGQICGALAEIAFENLMIKRYLPCKYVGDSNFEWDFEFGRCRIDVKAKQRSVECRPDYECSVADHQKAYKAHYYVFASVKDDTLVEFMGWMPKPEYWKTGHTVKGGQFTGITEHVDNTKMRYRDLKPMDEFIDQLELYDYKRAFGEVD